MKSSSDSNRLAVQGTGEAAVIYAVHEHLGIPVGDTRKSRTATRASSITYDYLSDRYPARMIPVGESRDAIKRRVYRDARTKMFGPLGGLLLGWLIKQIVALIVDWYFG